MNLETMIVEKNVDLYKNFGWELTETKNERVRRGRIHKNITKYVLARNKDIKNYSTIKQLESKYFKLYDQKQVYKPMESGVVFLLFVCFIVPGIIYVCYKENQHNKIYQYNRKLEEQMRTIVKQAQSLIQ